MLGVGVGRSHARWLGLVVVYGVLGILFKMYYWEELRRDGTMALSLNKNIDVQMNEAKVSTMLPPASTYQTDFPERPPPPGPPSPPEPQSLQATTTPAPSS